MPLSRERIAQLRRMIRPAQSVIGAQPKVPIEDLNALLDAAERDADVRVLDEWRGPGSLHRQWEMWYVPDEENDQLCSLSDTREDRELDFSGPTPEDARHAAAQAIEKERET